MQVVIEGGSISADVSITSYRTFDSAFRCQALLVPDEAGGYAAHALDLPGVVSQGETEEEALANLTEAFRETIRGYVDSGESIPWTDVDVEHDSGAIERWVLVDVQ